MNYISAENISKSFGTKQLFSGLSFGLNKGEKAAIVARNGKGKSTLLKIIAQQETADTGEVRINSDIKWSYLSQEPITEPRGNVIEYMLSADDPAVKAMLRYHTALEAYEKDPSEANLAAMQHGTELMETHSAWDVESKLQQILGKLGIYQLFQPLASLSGGQKKRVALARVLLESPELLILDEPTNHLDLEMVEWLEEYLTQSNLALLLVTHDRYFLDNLCDLIFEMEDEQFYRHSGNYTDFLQNKAEREAQQAREVDKAKNLLRKELEWARRMPKARGTKAKYRMDGVEKLKEKATGRNEEGNVELEVNTSRLGKKIMEIKHLAKSFGEKAILNDFSYVFKRGEKIGIVGPNGAGKTTFLNLITGELPADGGEIEKGQTLVIGYYKQSGMELPQDKRVIEVIQDIADFIPLANGMQLSAAQMLQRFLFEPEQQYAYVSTLSGGESRRLYLLTILMENPNFLILDEPTNDLDLMTLNVLEDFLEEFPGCVIVVTHDRYFLDRIAEHLFVLEGNGEVRDFNGRFLEYKADKMERDRAAKRKAEAAKAEQKAASEMQRKQNRGNKPSSKEIREFENLETEIAELESEKATIAEKMNTVGSDFEELNKLSQRVQEIGEALDEKMLRWMELSEKME